jgi:hypothetical protein
MDWFRIRKGERRANTNLSAEARRAKAEDTSLHIADWHNNLCEGENHG